MTRRNDFEVGPDGGSFTIANSDDAGQDPAAVVTPAATWVYTNNFIHGTFAVKANNQPTASATAILGWQEASSGTSYAVREYFDLDGDQTGSPSFPTTGGTFGIQIRNTADGRVVTGYVDSAGKLRLAASGGDIGGAVGTVALPSATGRYRLELVVDQIGTSTTDATVAVYAGESGTAIDSITATNFTAVGPADRHRIGKAGTAVMGNFILDSMEGRVGQNTFIGPISISATVNAQTANATGDVPFDASGSVVNLSLEQQNPVPGVGDALAPDAFQIQFPGGTAAGAGAALDATVAIVQNASFTPEVATGSGAAISPTVVTESTLPTTGSLAELKQAVYAALGSAGPTLDDAEHQYFASVSGLPAASRSTADHKRAFYQAQTGLGASSSLTDLEFAYWAIIDPTNNTGSYQDRARRFFGGD